MFELFTILVAVLITLLTFFFFVPEKEDIYPHPTLVIPKIAYNKKKKIFDSTRIPADKTPLFCFVNSKSGGQEGKEIIRELSKYLNYFQIIDLNKTSLKYILIQICTIKNAMILVCGGDGTVGWIMDLMPVTTNSLPIAILPLGTGNDLAYVLGWGQGSSCSDVQNILSILDKCNQVKQLSIDKIDRWKITIGDKVKLFTNYFSIGVDAQISYNFHTMRKQNPENFVSRLINKLWYGLIGGYQIITQDCGDLYEHIELYIDNVKIDLPDDTQGLIFCNINSYAGGVAMVSDDSFVNEPSYNDGFIEILTVAGSLHLANIKAGTSSPYLVSQINYSSDIKVMVGNKSCPMQIDGEPWIEKTNVTVQVSLQKQVNVMKANILD